MGLLPWLCLAQVVADSGAHSLGEPPSEVATPTPVWVGGVSVGLATTSSPTAEETFGLGLRTSQVYVSRGAWLLGLDTEWAPVLGTALITPRLGLGRTWVFPHAYGSLQSAEIRYRDELLPGMETTIPQGQAYSYRVVEPGEAIGWVVDSRTVALAVGPRLIQGSQVPEAVTPVGMWIGLVGVWQRMPTWTEAPLEPGQTLHAESTWFGSAGAAYELSRWVGEVSVGVVGGPSHSGRAARLLHGMVVTRVGVDTFELGLGLGVGAAKGAGSTLMPPVASGSVPNLPP